ncbi:MAG: hypothetical protein M5U28_19315 [Sandaracinaceae bacterium]|nr:hypothetical protein [Sandaracinaceae bacterium]
MIVLDARASRVKRSVTSVLAPILLVEHLDGDLRTDDRVLGAVHRSHAAHPEQRDDAVAADHPALERDLPCFSMGRQLGEPRLDLGCRERLSAGARA